MAQVPTPGQVDDSQLINQQQRERALRERQERRPDVRLEGEAPKAAQSLPAQEKPCFPIARFELQGERASEFQWALQSAITPDDPPASGVDGARCLGAKGINTILARVQNAIIHQGFVTTRVVAPQQDLRKGVLVMTLIPGTLSSVRMAPGSDERAYTENVLPIAPPNLVNLRDLEQALETFKRLPSAEADIQIAPAQPVDGKAPQPGQSDLLIQWRQGRPWRVGVSVDDSGTKATGKLIGNASLSWDHPLGLNDQVTVNLNHDLGGASGEGPRGTRGGWLSYSVPFGYWLVSTSLSRADYHQTVAGQDESYVYSGQSDSVDLRASRMVYRDAQRKLSAWGSLWSRSSKNYVDDTEVEIQRRHTSGWQAGLTHREYMGSSVLDASLAYRRGFGGLGSMPAPEEIFDEGTSRMQIVTADAQWNQPFKIGGAPMRYLGSVRAQWNQTALVPQDRFSIGGRYTVRGFDGETLLTAERGFTVRNDVGWHWSPSAEGYVGVDYGQVSGPSAIFLSGNKLAGVVLGVRGGWQVRGTQQWGYDVFVGAPLMQPEGFGKRATIAGFSLNWQY